MPASCLHKKCHFFQRKSAIWRAALSTCNAHVPPNVTQFPPKTLYCRLGGPSWACKPQYNSMYEYNNNGASSLVSVLYLMSMSLLCKRLWSRSISFSFTTPFFPFFSYVRMCGGWTTAKNCQHQQPIHYSQHRSEQNRVAVRPFQRDMERGCIPRASDPYI